MQLGFVHHMCHHKANGMVLLILTWAIAGVLGAVRHMPGAPFHAPIPTIAPYSLATACATELRDICELRSPYNDRAIKCFDAHRPELSPSCLEWHEARMQCKTQIEGASYDLCPDCRIHCGHGKSLLHCLRAAGNRMGLLQVNSQCTDTAFFRSMNRRARIQHALEN